MEFLYNIFKSGYFYKIFNVVIRYISEVAGGYVKVSEDLSRYTFMLILFIVAYFLARTLKQINKSNSKYLEYGFLIGLVRSLFFLLIISYKLIVYPISTPSQNMSNYWYLSLVPLVDYSLNFVCTGILSIAFYDHVVHNVTDSVRQYIHRILHIWLISTFMSAVYIISGSNYIDSYTIIDLLVAYWGSITFVIIAVPIFKLFTSKRSWIRDNMLAISFCWLFYSLVDIVDIFLCHKYTLILEPMKNIIYTISLLVFIYIYLKELFMTLEFKTNEARLLASDREFIIKGFSHEIRTPLIALAGFLKAYDLTNSNYNNNLSDTEKRQIKKLCPKESFCDRIVEDGVPEMRSAIRYISNILDNLSEYGRDSSKHAVDKFELTSLTNIGVKYAKFSDEAKRIPSSNIICKPVDEDVYVMLSPSKYLQVLQNLIRNSLRAVTMPEMPKDREPTIVIKSSISADNKECSVCVIDNGIGMTSDQVEKCTEKYWTTKDTNARDSGLGLYFVKLYMEEFGGQLVIDSSPDHGTSICLIFKIIS